MKPLVYRKTRKKNKAKRIPRARKMHVTKGDQVRVMRGNDRGKEGVVLHAYPRTGRVTIEGVNIVKRHRRPMGEGQEGGIIQSPAPISVSNVMLLDAKEGKPTRVRRRVNKDGTAERIGVKSGQPIPRTR